jgi:Zn-dependent protease with chaperone function
MEHEDSLDLNIATFYDGVSAREHQVQITLKDQGLLICSDTLPEPREWTYIDMRLVADLASQVGASYRVMSGPGRLNVHDEDLVARLKNLAINHNKSDISKSSWKRIGMWGVGAVVSVAVIVFVLIPALSNQLATMIPVEREIALGRTSIKQIERFLTFGDDKPLTCNGIKGQAALDKMTARLSAYVDSPYPLDIKVFNNEMPNAFAVPGGHIVLFDGLIQDANTPEEVAAVLGHEMGHVINRDPTRLTLRSAGSVGILGMVFGDFAGGAVALIIAEQLIAADYSQEAEANADVFAHDLLASAKLPSSPMAVFFEKLHKEFGDEPGLLSHLASHPDLLGRAQAAKDADTIGERSYKAVLTTSEWNDLKAMCAKQKVDAKSKSE